MCEGPNRPDIDLLVVLLALEDFRGKVEWSSANSGPELLRFVDGPAEVAYFGHTLNSIRSTQVKTIFYSLMSLWITIFECM